VYVESSDFNYSSLDFENRPGNEKMASTVPEKTIRITVEQQTSEYAIKLIAYFVIVQCRIQFSYLCSTVVECRSLASELSLSGTRPVADG